MKQSLLKIALSLTFVALTGCATSQETMLPVPEDQTMMDIWQQTGGVGQGVLGNANASQRQLLDARSQLRRPLPPDEIDQKSFSRDAENEIRSQFKRLPNPDLTLYVFPHLVGGPGEQVPVPGYTTIFPLYSTTQYAMPGESSRPGHRHESAVAGE